MDVNFAKNLTEIAAENTAAVITSDPHPMGGMNHAAVTLHIDSIVDQSSGTPGLTVQAEGSNDGVNYVTVAGVVILNQTATGTYSDEGDFTFAFIRFTFTLDAQGSANEWASMTFDVHANLTQT